MREQRKKGRQREQHETNRQHEKHSGRHGAICARHETQPSRLYRGAGASGAYVRRQHWIQAAYNSEQITLRNQVEQCDFVFVSSEIASSIACCERKETGSCATRNTTTGLDNETQLLQIREVTLVKVLRLGEVNRQKAL